MGEYQDAAAHAAAAVAVVHTRRMYGYLADYYDVLKSWLKIATHAADNLFFSGVLSAVIAFALMNYSLLMILARFREMTYRMREFGLVDDMDLITDESFCLLYTSPSPRDRTRSRMPSSA